MNDKQGKGKACVKAMQGEEENEVVGEDLEVRSYKILVLGNSGAGKTSLVRRSVRDYFSRDYRSAPPNILCCVDNEKSVSWWRKVETKQSIRIADVLNGDVSPMLRGAPKIFPLTNLVFWTNQGGGGSDRRPTFL